MHQMLKDFTNLCSLRLFWIDQLILYQFQTFNFRKPPKYLPFFSKMPCNSPNSALHRLYKPNFSIEMTIMVQRYFSLVQRSDCIDNFVRPCIQLSQHYSIFKGVSSALLANPTVSVARFGDLAPIWRFLAFPWRQKFSLATGDFLAIFGVLDTYYIKTTFLIIFQGTSNFI